MSRCEDEQALIVTEFDKVCFSIGDLDAIEMAAEDGGDTTSVCYFELQEHSKILACQLLYRYRPDYVLIDCQGWPGAETVATLACMRLQIPFVPVSCLEQHSSGRLDSVVTLLRNSTVNVPQSSLSIVAITVCKDDQDPILSIFQQAGVHSILYLENVGSMREQLSVPQVLISRKEENAARNKDDLYIMFTSGTSTATPKAVIGSHSSTMKRLKWFQESFTSSPRIARRTKLTFVDGVTELWACMLDPDSLLVSLSPRHLSGMGVPALISKTRCTQILLLPSQLGQLLRASTINVVDKNYASLQRVIVSGEMCPSQLLADFLSAFPKTELLNFYGQTETTGDCCAAILTNSGQAAVVDQIVAIGTPIAGNNIRIDAFGELLVTNNLCNGYLHRSTDGHGQQLSMDEFRTGDIGFVKDGQLYVKGRKDEVIKVNGIWTSPQEVLAAFCAYDGTISTDQAAAIMMQDKPYIVCTSQSAVDHFSRSDMYEKGKVPWNLIPRQVLWYGRIPFKTGGAGKIDRQQLQQIIRDSVNSVAGATTDLSPSAISTKAKNPHTGLETLISKILSIDVNSIDPSMSFVDLGGESATAISLLYALRGPAFVNSDPTHSLSAIDILTSDSVNDLQKMIEGVKSAKRRKWEDAIKVARYSPRPTIEVSPSHLRTALQACVDATAIIHAGFAYVCCQGGVIAKVDPGSLSIVSYRQFPGFRIQGDPLTINDSIVVSAYSFSGDRGMVARLSLDLDDQLWVQNFDAMKGVASDIKTSPITLNGIILAAVGEGLCGMDVDTGKITGTIPKLPFAVSTTPILRQQNGNEVLVFGVSDYDGGLLVIDETLDVTAILQYTIGPVHKSLTPIPTSPHMMLVCDSWGSVHRVDLNSIACDSTKVADFPLSSPAINRDGAIVVGSYDGTVKCVKEKEIVWSANCFAAVYSKPLILDGGNGVLVCTTAGDIVEINQAGVVIQSRRIFSAEIWSDPIQVGTNVIFGARDSCVHTMTLT